MKKFLTLVVALVTVIPMMAIGRNDGSTKANAIDFDWESPMSHDAGTKWYRVDLAPLYEEESPALNLFLANKDAFNDTHTSLKATVAGQTDEKSFTIHPKQQRVWSANATMLVRLKQVEIYLTLTSDGPVMMSARVFEAQDLDETCQDALSFNWATGITKPAGVPVWYKVNIKEAKAKTDKDVCVVVTNNGSKKLTLYAGQSLDCPSSGVTKRTIELAAGQVLRDTIPNSMLNGVAFDEMYVSLENDQPITVTAEYANRPPVPVMPADAGQYEEKIVPDTSLHKYDTTLLTAGMTYYFKYDVAKLNALKKYEPEFTFRNASLGAISIERKMSFEVPAYVAQGNVLELGAGEESIEVLTKNTLLGLENEFIYVKIKANSNAQLISRFKHIREGKACKTNIDYNWDGGNRQDAKTTQWYAIDLTEAKASVKDLIVHVEDLNPSASAHVKASLAFSCPYIDLQEITRTVEPGKPSQRRVTYSTYAMMTDTVWIGVETDQDIKFWATLEDAQKQAVVDSICLQATEFDWESGVQLQADTTVWYLLDMTKVRDLAAKFPTVFAQNLSSTEAAVITAELSLECPDSIANDKQTKTIEANGTYSKQLSRNMFENIKKDTIYLKVHSTQALAIQIRLTEEAEGASCSSAIPFNWISGNTQKANENLWYSVDLREVMKNGYDIKLHVENRDNASCKAVAQLIYECPNESAPSVQDFTLGAAGTAKGERTIKVQNSAFETLSDSIVYVNLQGTTGIRFWVEELPAKPFDTINASDIAHMDTLYWDSLYTQTVDTAWYIIPNSEILRVRNMDEKVKPVAHMWNPDTKENAYKAEAAFAFPITKTMMSKTQKLKAGQHKADTVPSGTFDQFLKKDSVILRVVRPAGSADFQFKAELVKAFSGNTRADALPIRMGELYTQGANTEMWYKLNLKDLKKPDLYNKRLWVNSKNAGAGDAEVTVSVYEGLMSEEDLLEAYGLGDYRQRTIKKGENKSHDVPAQAIYGVGDGEFYIKLRTTDSLVFESKFLSDYPAQAVDPKQAEAKLLVPNVEYVVPGDNEEHWYQVCIPYMQNNYIYTDDAKLAYEINGAATIEGTFTFQDQMDCAMPVRKRTINKSGGYHNGTKPVRELIEKALKKAGYTFDFEGTAPSFIDSLLHRYITKDSVTAYIRLKTNNELKVKLILEQTTGDACTNPMMFDWEHGNVNPAGADSWYYVHLLDVNGTDTIWTIPDTCDLRLHVDNWEEAENDVHADLYFDCNDPATVSKSYTLAANGKDSIDIDRDVLVKLGADMIINYTSSKVSHIWAELIPDVPRDTLRDTIVAYVCQGDSYNDTITGVVYDPIDYSIEWYDTVTIQDGVVMIDSITLFQVHPLVVPTEITVDSMKKLNAAPLLVQGMQLYVDASSKALTTYYKNLGNTVDTITRIDTVYWAKPVYKASGELNDKTEAALDLTSYYPKSRTEDTLLLVIKSDTCDVIYRKDIVFPLEAYKYPAKNDTVCPPLPAQNPDTMASVLVVDTLGLNRYVDTVVTYYAYAWPTMYTKDELVALPSVAAGSAIDTTNTIASLMQKIAEDATDLTMPVTAIDWQVKVGGAWQEAHGYNVPASATDAELRYVLTTLCADTPSVSMHFDISCTNDTIKWDGDPATGCEVYHWDLNNQDYTESDTYYYDDGELIPGSLCHRYYELKVVINHKSYTNLDEVKECDEYTWKLADKDTVITTSGTYTHVLTNKAGCDSIITLPVVINKSYTAPVLKDTACNYYDWRGVRYTETGIYYDSLKTVHGDCDSVYTLDLKINGTSFVDTLEVKAYYGYRIIMINRNEINNLEGWADLDSLHFDHPKYVNWYKMLGAKPDKDNDEWKARGYYYTLPSGDPLPAGDKYYAYIELPASPGAICGSVGMTEVITIGAAAPAPALVPTLARPGENIKVLNLDPMTETTIRIYSAEGILQGVYTASGEETFVIRAASENGFYLVELSNDSMKSTLRYIVK